MEGMTSAESDNSDEDEEDEEEEVVKERVQKGKLEWDSSSITY